MHQRHSAKSVPPALIDEGRRYFFYDDDDQLTQVVVSNAWRTVFQYSGRRRKRITRDYAWPGSTWIKTNEVHYVYDGMLVIQERDANNLPIKTYTRGLDLTGSLQGAGGIGGLLALTDNKALPTTHYYYHADANGNVRQNRLRGTMKKWHVGNRDQDLKKSPALPFPSITFIGTVQAYYGYILPPSVAPDKVPPSG